MFYFHPYTGMTKKIGVLSNKFKIFTSKANKLLIKAFLQTFPPARFSLINLSPVPVPPAQNRQGINLRNYPTLPYQAQNYLYVFPDKAQATIGTFQHLRRAATMLRERIQIIFPLETCIYA